jgi:hypothetical protein
MAGVKNSVDTQGGRLTSKPKSKRGGGNVLCSPLAERTESASISWREEGQAETGPGMMFRDGEDGTDMDARGDLQPIKHFMVFKENVYASLIDCAQRVSAPAEGAGHSDVSSWITSELGWNVRRPQVQAPRSRSRDASLLGPCRLKDGAPPLEVQAQTRGSRTLLCLTRAWTRQFTLKPGETTGRSSSSPALSLLAPGKSPRDR